MKKRTFDEMVSYFDDKVLDMNIEQKYKTDLIAMMTAIQMAGHDMKILKWIPVSEALPKDMDRLLVTIVRSDGSKRVRSGNYYKGYFMLDNGDTWNATDKEIQAWMPLVEPWRGE